MSGGSHNYLCFSRADELFPHEDDLQKMAEALAEVGYAKDAARETEELLCIVRQCRVRLDTRIDRLKGIWQAVEWWHSGDSSEEYLKRELLEYRASGAE